MKQAYYIAIIGDIRESKHISDRIRFQEQLERVLADVNGRLDFPSLSKFVEAPPLFYKGHLDSIRQSIEKKEHGFDCFRVTETTIASNFMITLGDEFQGLLTTGIHLMRMIDHIERTLFPIRLRFGIGIGEIYTNITRENPFGMDGPAYHIARGMLSQLKVADRKTLEPAANMKIGIQDNDRLSLLVNTMFTLLTTIKETWTESQVRVMNTFMKDGGQKQRKTADILGIKQPSVQKSLSASQFYTYQYALNVISLVLKEFESEYANS
ncbi:MAG: SatD family protein [Spirochaetota bacterium]